jgi:hypothetical protein
MTDDDDAFLQAWGTVLALYRDFLDGWSPSTDEPGVMIRGGTPYIKKHSAILRHQRKITLH